MITTKKTKLIKISFIGICIILCVAVMLGVGINTTYAESNSNLIVETNIQEDGSESLKISNIQPYITSNRARTSSAARELVLFETMGYDKAQIEQLSDEQKNQFKAAKEISVTTKSFSYEQETSEITEDTNQSPLSLMNSSVESPENSAKFSMKSIAVYSRDEKIDGVMKRIYKLTGIVSYQKNVKYKDIPSNRSFVYPLVLMWDSAAKYNNYGTGYVKLDRFNYWSNKKDISQELNLGDRFISQNSPYMNTFGIDIDLPNNSLSYKYGNYTLYNECEVFATSSFTTKVGYAISGGLGFDGVTMGSDGKYAVSFKANPDKTFGLNHTIKF